MSLGAIMLGLRQWRAWRARVKACDHPKEMLKTRKVGLDWELRCTKCGRYMGALRS